MHGPFRMHGQPQPAALDHCARAITGDKGRHGQIFGIDAQKQMAHGRIAHGNDAVHMVLVDGEAPEKAAHGFGNALDGHGLHLLEIFTACCSGNPAQHVGSEHTLRVGRTVCIQHFAGKQIDEVDRDGRRTDIKDEAVPEGMGIAGFDGDQFVLNQHRGNLKIRLPHNLRQAAQQAESHLLVLAHLSQNALQIGRLIPQAGLGQLDELLLDQRIGVLFFFLEVGQTDLSPDVIPASRDLDDHILPDQALAGKNLAVPPGHEERLIPLNRSQRSGTHLHGAFAANAAPSALRTFQYARLEQAILQACSRLRLETIPLAAG